MNVSVRNSVNSRVRAIDTEKNSPKIMNMTVTAL